MIHRFAHRVCGVAALLCLAAVLSSCDSPRKAAESLGVTITEYSAHPRPETAAKVEKDFTLLDAQIEKLRAGDRGVEADIWQQERDKLQLRYAAAQMAGNIQTVQQAAQELGNAFRKAGQAIGDALKDKSGND